MGERGVVEEGEGEEGRGEKGKKGGVGDKKSER